ncbi:MAG: YSC84-related protein, partial [Rhodobacteraceae bacterium]|nr:YSC84-related protein [Paracoccaceae bacterium]
MGGFSRRGVILGGGAAFGLAACGNGLGSQGAAKLDARVDESRQFLLAKYPGTRDLEAKAAGVLWMPLVTEVALGFGGTFGQGALRVGGATVDYYSVAGGSWGIQAGAQQYSHALFFMTPDALAGFRAADGWTLGADAKYATPEEGGSLGADTTTTLNPVVALVFGQAGLI